MIQSPRVTIFTGKAWDILEKDEKQQQPLRDKGSPVLSLKQRIQKIFKNIYDLDILSSILIEKEKLSFMWAKT